jgi:fused signal recognition particle receptor
MARWFPWQRKKNTEPATSSPTASEAGVDPSESFLEDAPDEQGEQSEENELDRSGSLQAEVSPQPLSPITQTSRRSLWRRGLSRLRRVFLGPIDRLFRGRPFSEEILAELEEALIIADVGVQTSTALVERLRQRCRTQRPESADVLKTYLKEELLTLLAKVPFTPLVSSEVKPWVILMVGVNGVGKTTTIAKLTARFLQQRKKVLLVAADTFRAAASEQLEVWSKRLGVDCVKHASGASPAAVAFDGIRAALARGVDIVIVDTAGRLHTKAPLMEELKKVHRVIDKELPGAPHEVLLVLDASTGQNALNQARAFQQAFPLTGVILAKMDGSARGGVAFSIIDQLGIPIRCLGLGEKVEDLQDFSAAEFVEAIFTAGEEDVSLDMEARGS